MKKNELETFNNISLIKEMIKIYVHEQYDVDIKFFLNPDIVFLNRHKLLPIWFYCIHQLNIEREIGKFTYQMVQIFLAKQKKDALTKEKEIISLANTFAKNDLNFAVRKGISICNLYKEKSHRTFNDIDLMIKKNDADLFNKLLNQEGFEVGLYDQYKNEKSMHHRRDIINYKLNPDHCPHRIKMVGDVPVIIDLAFSSYWFGHEHFEELVLDKMELVEKNGLNCLTGISLLTDLLLHLYRESKMVNSLMKRPPYFLSYFDILLIAQKIKNPKELLDQNSYSVFEDVMYLQDFYPVEILNYKINVSISNIKDSLPFEIFRFMSVPYRADEKEMIGKLKRELDG
ncbi:nucleotidyltransferase family protein [Photorhabdus laumondii]